MALLDNSVLAVGDGHWYTAPVGTTFPTDLENVDATWTEVGNTSLEDILKWDSEGGDETTLGTLQNKSLRTTRTPRVDSFTINLQQFDQASQKLFWGSNAVVDSITGLLQVPQDPVPTTCAFLGVLIDGVNQTAIYCPKAEVFRADNMEISDTQSLASLPLKVTPLVLSPNNWAVGILPIENDSSSSSV